MSALDFPARLLLAALAGLGAWRDKAWRGRKGRRRGVKLSHCNYPGCSNPWDDWVGPYCSTHQADERWVGCGLDDCYRPVASEDMPVRCSLHGGRDWLGLASLLPPPPEAGRCREVGCGKLALEGVYEGTYKPYCAEHERVRHREWHWCFTLDCAQWAKWDGRGHPCCGQHGGADYLPGAQPPPSPPLPVPREVTQHGLPPGEPSAEAVGESLVGASRTVGRARPVVQRSTWLMLSCHAATCLDKREPGSPYCKSCRDMAWTELDAEAREALLGGEAAGEGE